MGVPVYSCLQERLFYNSIVVDGDYTTECWMWLGTLTPQHYGKLSFRVNGRVVKLYAHRVSFELFKAPIPVGFEVDHLCQNPWCIHPDHLQAIPAARNKALIKQRRISSAADRPLEYT